MKHLDDTVILAFDEELDCILERVCDRFPHQDVAKEFLVCLVRFAQDIQTRLENENKKEIPIGELN